MKDNKFVIRIFDEIGGDSAISVDDGIIVYNKIDKAFTQSLNVTLDFQNIDLLITAFLNAAIGQLYSKYTSDFLTENLNLINVKPEDVRLFQQVIQRAKEYFANPEDFEKSIKE